MTDLVIMLEHYIICALWSSQDYREEGLDPSNFDEWATADDLSPECVIDMTVDCAAFLRDEYTDEVAELWTLEQFGHDFWLTRNGHGAGFWDRGHGQLGQHLTDAAEVYGECSLYTGDDGKVYC